MHLRFLFLSCLLILPLFFPAVPVQAVEVAPRITDRQIVEHLTRLEEGQKNLDKRLSDMQAFNEQRFASMDQSQCQLPTPKRQSWDASPSLFGMPQVSQPSAVTFGLLNRAGRIMSRTDRDGPGLGLCSYHQIPNGHANEF